VTIPAYSAIEQTSAKVGDVVLDTSVLMDCLFLDRPGHTQAVNLAKVLKGEKSTVFIPAHYYFELVSGVLCEKRVRKQALSLGEFKRQLPFEPFIVTIDERFVIDYLIRPVADGNVIDLKGGDMIFAALALGLQIPFITEDRKARNKVREIGGPLSASISPKSRPNNRVQGMRGLACFRPDRKSCAPAPHPLTPCVGRAPDKYRGSRRRVLPRLPCVCPGRFRQRAFAPPYSQKWRYFFLLPVFWERALPAADLEAALVRPSRNVFDAAVAALLDVVSFGELR